PTWSDSAAFGCFKREIFAQIGLFDERLLSNSDMDLNMRIRAAGGRILLVPEIVVNYYADSNIRAFWKHNYADGVWTTYVLKFGSNAWSWRHWIPFAFVLSVLGTLSLSTIFPHFLGLGLIVAGAYAFASLAVSAQITIREKVPKQLFVLPCVFAVRHVG